mmetsp:Transcript_58588/g.65541  ORF Transcript_58588/g.65541 Transcript_58588/m.65541 type:complete len:105 (+) Transcript_58588:297-611(+)
MGVRQQHSSSTTRLYFSDFDDISNTYTTCTTINHQHQHQQQWWKKLLKYSPTSLSASGTSTSTTGLNPSIVNGSDDQQDNDVDISTSIFWRKDIVVYIEHENDE